MENLLMGITFGSIPMVIFGLFVAIRDIVDMLDERKNEKEKALKKARKKEKKRLKTLAAG